MGEDAVVVPGGHRRIDRLLGQPHELTGLSMAELRRLRDDAEQEETDASYLRRLLQGRVDLCRAELARRSGAGGELMAELPKILGSERPGAPRGLGRHTAVEPSRADAHRRYVEALTADVDLSDVSARSDDQLAEALETYRAEESRLSGVRRQLQGLMDACHAELTRRYRDGEADPSALLDEFRK